MRMEPILFPDSFSPDGERYRLIPEGDKDNNDISIACCRSFSRSSVMKLCCSITVEEEEEGVLSYISINFPVRFNDEGYAILDRTIEENVPGYERNIDSKRCRVKLSLEYHRGVEPEIENYVMGRCEIYDENGKHVKTRFGDQIPNPEFLRV